MGERGGIKNAIEKEFESAWSDCSHEESRISEIENEQKGDYDFQKKKKKKNERMQEVFSAFGGPKTALRPKITQLAGTFERPSGDQNDVKRTSSVWPIVWP